MNMLRLSSNAEYSAAYESFVISFLQVISVSDVPRDLVVNQRNNLYFLNRHQTMLYNFLNST